MCAYLIQNTPRCFRSYSSAYKKCGLYFVFSARYIDWKKLSDDLYCEVHILWKLGLHTAGFCNKRSFTLMNYWQRIVKAEIYLYVYSVMLAGSLIKTCNQSHHEMSRSLFVFVCTSHSIGLLVIMITWTLEYMLICKRCNIFYITLDMCASQL